MVNICRQPRLFSQGFICWLHVLNQRKGNNLLKQTHTQTSDNCDVLVSFLIYSLINFQVWPVKHFLNNHAKFLSKRSKFNVITNQFNMTPIKITEFIYMTEFRVYFGSILAVTNNLLPICENSSKTYLPNCMDVNFLSYATFSF